GGAREERDGLGHVDRQAALLHRVHATPGLAGRERDRGGHLRLDEAGGHGVDGDLLRGQLGGGAVDKADHAGLGGGVVGLAAVARDAGHRGHADHAAVLGERALLRELGGDALGGGDIDGDDRVPAARVHPGERLVAGDAGVVHEHVHHALVAVLDVRGQDVGGVGGGHVERERGAPDGVGGLRERLPGGGDVAADHVRAVTGQYGRDLGADAACRTGDHGDLALERRRPGGGGRGAAGTDLDDLGVDVGRPARQEEAQRGLEARRARVRVGGDVDQLDGGAPLHLLAEGPGEALERTLGDPLLDRAGLVRGGAQDHHAAARGDAADDRVEELEHLL